MPLPKLIESPEDLQFLASDNLVGVDSVTTRNITFPSTRHAIGSTVDSRIGENPICPCGQQNHIQFPAGMRCRTKMDTKGYPSRGRRVVDYAAAAVEQMQHYCATHPW